MQGCVELTRLMSNYGRVLAMNWQSVRLEEEKVFKDPVHRYIYVQDQVIWSLINTSEFQRLRRIRQLGTTYLTFHGAEHSRFSHSLGVYEITRKIISQFERLEGSEWPVEQRLLSLCAALLHDIGHGPFSHSMEQVFDLYHESWTVEIILGETEIHNVLKQVDPSFPEQVAAVIKKTYSPGIVVDLVSSQLDADRMDYLLRDAYYTGVNYGTFDLERMLRVIRPHNGRLVVKASGMHTVEDYLMSRYQMYWQVYFHPVTRSAEIVLRNTFHRARHLLQDQYHFEFMLDPMPKLLEGNLSVAEYLAMDESFILTTLIHWTKEKDPILSDLAARFVHRKLFKYETLKEGSDVKQKLLDRIVEEGWDPRYYLTEDSPEDLPYDVYGESETDDCKKIMLIDDQERLMNISDASEILQSISGIHKGVTRIYFPKKGGRPHVD